ncbi:hypothetical protein RHODGE_RHODGE_01042 [Rhodoplanes serenus]|uniref:DUF4376 domain-containing protein n=1 Tax=Rhodoplanes serenus TaxID=200615 RepID=A0A3S4F6A0_9BRAD|nr:DUF4376 domain-containing protein [Rhodoplanes serenus]VCU06565.1 hypothetical protein RHODPL_RHODPL_00013 [Rhodoplanes serenus]VCU07892.1 hypothetical protein RHODGE_RHODGE_01042 [Rhodoplanes serenus]
MIWTPQDHYWIVAGDETRVWSSARGDYVPTNDAPYTAWREAGGVATRISTEQDLTDVLALYGLRGPHVDLAAYAADARWRRETGGTTWRGWPIHTDATSQTKYLAELQAISLGVRDDGDGWKFADGAFRAVSNADFSALATAARAHVRACFAAEAAVLAGIAAGTITTPAEIDAAFAAVGAAE